MREKKAKFRKEKIRRCAALTRDDMKWLSENTHFDPDNISEWFKVRKVEVDGHRITIPDLKVNVIKEPSERGKEWC